MSNHLFTTIQIFAAVAFVVGAWQSAQADDLSARRDEARLVLIEEHVEEIAAADRKVAQFSAAGRGGERQLTQALTAKRVAADAINAIVTDYFLTRRIKPAAVGDEQSQTKYIQDVSPLHEMIVLASQCKAGDAASACEKLAVLIEKVRVSSAAGGNPSKGQDNDSHQEPANPMRQVRAGEAQDGGDDEIEIQISEAERMLFKIVNAYRKKQGLDPLVLDEKLCRAARDHSGDMKKHNFFSHQSPVPGRARFTDRAGNYGAKAAAENIARDCKDAQMAMRLWVNSQLHRANLTGAHTRIGVGVDENGLYTQVFGK